jgi:hypothetical protein
MPYLATQIPANGSFKATQMKSYLPRNNREAQLNVTVIGSARLKTIGQTFLCAEIAK